MPKPLLSGYFTNHLNSVRNVKEVQKSLDSANNLCMSQDSNKRLGSLDDIREAEEIPHSELMRERPQLKIKQSLNRDFSIENLKRAAGSHKRMKEKNARTPSEIFKTMEPYDLGIDKTARTPKN